MAILPWLNLLKLSRGILLKLHAGSGSFGIRRELWLGQHHLFDLLGDATIFTFLTNECLVLLIVGDGGILAILEPLEQPGLIQVLQCRVHLVLVQELILHLLLHLVLDQDLIL